MLTMLKRFSDFCFWTGIIIIFLPYPAMPEIGAALLLLGVLLRIMGKEDDPVGKARMIFLGIFIALAWGIARYELSKWTAINQSTAFVDRLIIQAWSWLVGAGISAAITVFLFLLTVYISGAYVLALKDAEGLNGWQAFKSLLSLMLNTQYDWVVIADGKISVTKKKGVLKKLGGPGKVVIQPGNAVVFERGGTISRIAGAGVVLTKNFEVIREVIDLRKQFHLETIEAVTADKITVKVEAAVVYQILPATETPGGTLLTDNMNLYPVTEETLRKAVFGGTAGGWHGYCRGAPLNVVRDQIMALTLDTLFESDGSANSRTIEAIERNAVAEVNKFASGMGVKIIGVDIRSIKLPKAVMDEVAKSRRLRADAETMHKFEEERNAARQTLIHSVLRIITAGKKPVDTNDVALATELIKATGQLKTDDVFSRERLEMLEKMAASDGAKIISAGGSTPPVETPISLEK